jgi:sulfur-carrier protein adenylyltransferase/sulfurtransferase
MVSTSNSMKEFRDVSASPKPSLPPLVEPAGELSREEVGRYSRHLIIPDLGVDGQKRLRNAKVLVIGAGGLGSPALLYLAAAGVGTLGIVEFDEVDSSNLQRQIIHGESDIGRSKAESARDSILEINSGIDVVLHTFRLDNDNAVELFRQYDLIVDGTDNFATRYLVNDAAVLAGKPYVWGSIYRFEGQVSVFWEDAPDGRGINYRDLYPEAPPPGMVPSCAEGGVLGVLCASIGSIMVTEAIKLITGIGEPLLGRLMVYDALDMSYRTIKLRRDPERAPITELIDYDAFCGVVSEEGQAAAAGSTITARELKDMLDAGKDVAIVDVREPVEWDIVRIEGAQLIPKDRILSGAALAELPQNRPIVLHCKTGIRSAEALAALKQAGFSDATHLQGGIIAWAKQIDPSLPVY